jgi:hypothetical protein
MDEGIFIKSGSYKKSDAGKKKKDKKEDDTDIEVRADSYFPCFLHGDDAQ